MKRKRGSRDENQRTLTLLRGPACPFCGQVGTITIDEGGGSIRRGGGLLGCCRPRSGAHRLVVRCDSGLHVWLERGRRTVAVRGERILRAKRRHRIHREPAELDQGRIGANVRTWRSPARGDVSARQRRIARKVAWTPRGGSAEPTAAGARREDATCCSARSARWAPVFASRATTRCAPASARAHTAGACSRRTAPPRPEFDAPEPTLAKAPNASLLPITRGEVRARLRGQARIGASGRSSARRRSGPSRGTCQPTFPRALWAASDAPRAARRYVASERQLLLRRRRPPPP